MWRGLFLEGVLVLSSYFDKLVPLLLEFRKMLVLIAKNAVKTRLQITPPLLGRTDSIKLFYAKRKTKK